MFDYSSFEQRNQGGRRVQVSMREGRELSWRCERGWGQVENDNLFSFFAFFVICCHPQKHNNNKTKKSKRKGKEETEVSKEEDEEGKKVATEFRQYQVGKIRYSTHGLSYRHFASLSSSFH